MSPLLVITGPTASGKSAFAMEIAKKYNGEIICADSRTLYKGMDIGTAKPSKQDQQEVPHHLLDIVAPDESFTVVAFKELANKAIADIVKRGKLPIMVGGTGLYVDAVIFDYQFGAPADPKKRQQLQELTVDTLQQICIDNNIPLPINTRNKRHLVRAIETGGAAQQEKRLRQDTMVVALTIQKEVLRARIAKRAQAMLEDGILDEIKQLAKQYGWESEAMTGNIYRVMRPVAEGRIGVAEGLQLLITSDMQLAKRQLTWLRRNPYIVWGTADQLKVTIEHFVQQNKLLESIPA